MLLGERNRDQPAHRIAPGNRAPRLAPVLDERVEDFELVGGRLGQRPALAGVGRRGERIALRQQDVAQATWCSFRQLVRRASAVAAPVQQQRAVPGVGQVDGPARAGSMPAFDMRDRGCIGRCREGTGCTQG